MSKIDAVIVCIALFFSACEQRNTFDAMGIFESDEILIAAEVSGKILDFNVKEGDWLKNGELLGRIDTSQLELKQQKIELELQQALKEQERFLKLYQANATTKQNLENADLKVLLLQQESQIIADEISRAKIISPIDGVVLEKYAFNGELSTPNKILLRVANTQALRLKAYISNVDLSRIRLGDKVRVLSDFGEDYREYEGVITWIASEAEFTPKTIMTKQERHNLVYAVKIDVQNDGYIKIGSYGEVLLGQQE